MTPKEYAIELLAKGIPTSQVAAAVGVDDSYISQLKADPEIQAQIASKQAATSIADSKFDETLERAEALALEKIEKNMQFATLGQALAAFRVLNGARRRNDALVTADNITSVTVNLTLPASSIPQYVTNNKAEIVEVEGKTMISATPKTLDSILAARAADKGLALPQTTSIEKAANLLESIKTPARQAPRRLPSVLSPDIL
jgi:hypothetical protein